jgi:hypothetical protein
MSKGVHLQDLFPAKWVPLFIIQTSGNTEAK